MLEAHRPWPTSEEVGGGDDNMKSLEPMEQITLKSVERKELSSQSVAFIILLGSDLLSVGIVKVTQIQDSLTQDRSLFLSDVKVQAGRASFLCDNVRGPRRCGKNTQKNYMKKVLMTQITTMVWSLT